VELTHKLKKYWPLLALFMGAIGGTTFLQFHYPIATLHTAMTDFMGVFFLIAGILKLYNLNAFAHAYARYDLLAQQSIHYGYFYPFIELALAIGYLSKLYLKQLNVFTLVLMLFNALGVFLQLKKGTQFECACMGTLFKVPLTYVTLLEDLIMAGMAMYMLFK
jgi:hypothetical protein